MNSPEPNEEKLERLAQALRTAEESRRIFVPPTLDEAILKKARAHFEVEKARPSRFRFWFSLAGAVAALVVIILLIPIRKSPTLARGDINADGQVDILDAMAMAKALESNNAPANMDQNGDGKIDEADVRAIAVASVQLDRKPGS